MIFDFIKRLFIKRKLDSYINLNGIMVDAILFNGEVKIVRKDRDYCLISKKDFLYLKEKYHTIDFEYIPEVTDCDDFTDDFLVDIKKGWAYEYGTHRRALCAGYASVIMADSKAGHAIVFHLDDKFRLRFYEPQNGKEIDTKKIETIRKYIY